MDLKPSTSEPRFCPECGASLPPAGKQCWLCGWKVGSAVGVGSKNEDRADVNPYVSPSPPSGENLKWTYNLSTLFLWVTLISIVFGVWKIAPGLGIALAIFGLPAALHTIALSAYRKRRSGESMTIPDKIGVFAASFGIFLMIAVVIAIAAIGAFFVICLADITGKNQNLPGQTMLVVGIAFGAMIGIGVGYVLLRTFWRQRN